MLRGQQLRRMRILKNITQEEIAEALDVKRNYISMLENEHREIPYDKYKKWIEYLNSKRAKEIRDKRLKKKAEKNTEK